MYLPYRPSPPVSLPLFRPCCQSPPPSVTASPNFHPPTGLHSNYLTSRVSLHLYNKLQNFTRRKGIKEGESRSCCPQSMCKPAAGSRPTGRMWIWYLLLGSGSGSSSVESQLLPGNNFTTECNIPGNFMCGDGKCVPGGWQCDGLPDCFDESDERGCPRVKSRCAATFFACASGMHCIIGRFRCNGFEDCPDGSDEENCTANPLLCSTTRFHCKNGRCVDRSFLCNGQDNCQDNTDEEDCESTSESVPGQDFVTLDYRLHYYPSITYAVIGSAVIFVLVVALLALALHHQRKRSVLLPRVGQHLHRLHQPLLLSRFVIVEPQHSCSASAASYSTTRGIQLLSGALYPRSYTMDTPPSYSQAVRDLSRPPWFDLPPPPYPPDGEEPVPEDLPPYQSRRGSTQSQDSPSESHTGTQTTVHREAQS